MKSDNAELIPELADWNNGDGISLEAWISGVGRFDHALGYAAVFWPQFTEFEGCVFRMDPDPGVFQDWMKSLKGDLRKVEAMMNHIHIVDVVSRLEYQPSKALLLRLGEILKEMWSCKLARDFPTKCLQVEFSKDKDDVSGLELTFFQISQ